MKLRLILPARLSFWNCMRRPGIPMLLMIVLSTLAAGSGHAQTLAQALNTTNLTWTTAGNNGASGWTAQSAVTHDGSLAAQSGILTNGQNSTLQTITNGPGTLTYWWYCPSFNEGLTFILNDAMLATVSGNSAWAQQTVYLGAGSQTSKWSYAALTFTDTQRGYLDEVTFTPGATKPVINTQPISQSQVPGLNVSFSVNVIGTPPLSYQWRLGGVDVPGATNAALTITNVQAAKLGNYSVVITNIGGSTVSSNATLGLGNVTAWGWNSVGQSSVALGASNVFGVAAGLTSGWALRSDGTVVAWGDNASGELNVPASLSNVVAIAGGDNHCLALKSDGTVVAWGLNTAGQTNVPAGLTNVVAVAGGVSHSLALKADGTVVAWGDNQAGQTNVPANLSNIVAIAASGSRASLALKSDGTVVAWGSNASSQTNVPAGLSNVVAISSGGFHALALKGDGRITGWGNNAGNLNLTIAPAALTNAVAISSGGQHNAVLKPDGSVLAWGYNLQGETNVPPTLTNVNALAAGGFHTVALVGNGAPATGVLASAPTISDKGFSVTIPSQSGRVYRLEYKTSLTSPDWVSLPLVAGTGKNLVLSDRTAPSGSRFYRVRRW